MAYPSLLTGSEKMKKAPNPSSFPKEIKILPKEIKGII